MQSINLYRVNFRLVGLKFATRHLPITAPQGIVGGPPHRRRERSGGVRRSSSQVKLNRGVSAVSRERLLECAWSQDPTGQRG